MVKYLKNIIVFLVTAIFAVFLAFAMVNAYKKGAGESEYLALLNIVEQVYKANNRYFEDNGVYANDLNDLIPDYLLYVPKRDSFEKIRINNNKIITFIGIKNRHICNEADTQSSIKLTTQSSVKLIFEITKVDKKQTKTTAKCI
jgi:hypothetical protein